MKGVGTSFIRARCTFFHTHASLLSVFVCLIVLFHSCCSHAWVFGKTLSMSSPFPKATLNGTSSFPRWCCPRKIFTGMLKTDLTQRYLSYTYAVKYICYTISLVVTVGSSYAPSQRHGRHPSNKWTNVEGVASVPHSTATMRNTCSSKIILPGASECTDKLEMRSINRLEELYLAAFEQGHHSQRKKYCYRPTVLRCLPRYPSTVAMKRISWQNILRLWPSQVDTVTIKSSPPVQDGYRYSGSYTA